MVTWKRPSGNLRMARKSRLKLVIAVIVSVMACGAALQAQTDPGVRGGAPGAGTAVKGLSPGQLNTFSLGSTTFNEIASVQGKISGTRIGLGPRFNGESCGSCHSQPAIGGTSPSVNPQIAAASDQGAVNTIPAFLSLSGPIREAHFIYQPDLVTPDGGVHDLFTITGRSDAGLCNIAQPDFATAMAENNLALRIPTPVFGAGLIEEIEDSTIVANMNANLTQKQALGIAGHPNYTPNGGNISRFGWKAQNPSILVFAGEASDVEMGVTNEMLPVERDETTGCVLNATPEDHTNFAALKPSQVMSAITTIDMFIRFLDQPTPAPPNASTINGQTQFNNVGCVLCHTTTLITSSSSVKPLGNVAANLFSDLLVHHMGPGLADNIAQGNAGGDEFRTAPLWGLGQRIFFLHDGRETDLLKTIQDHYSLGNGAYGNSEANQVINNFNALSTQNQQDLLNFLRSL
jgi:CxxC motif-containing protein (DUF1111 family)